MSTTIIGDRTMAMITTVACFYYYIIDNKIFNS